MNECIMAATDGEPGSLGALHCGRDVAAHFGLPLEVSSACEPSSAYGYEAPDLVAGVMTEMAEACRNIRQRVVLSQLAQAGIASRPFISVEIGSPAPVVARTAARRGAAMIVVGRGRHSAIDRLLADETALRLMQTARVPVLSVPDNYVGLPKRALAAIDFTSYSIDAARSAIALLTPGSELHLVHVSTDHGHHGLGTWRHSDFGAAVQQETRARLEATAEEIARTAPGITVSPHLLEGRPVQAVLRLAETIDVDLIAAGTNGYGFLGRLLMGSVATQLVRRSRFLTLIAPPRGVTPAADHSIPDLRRDRASVVREALSAVSGHAS